MHVLQKACLFFAVFLYGLPAADLSAQPLSYSRSTTIFKQEWNSRYPVEPVKITGNPSGKGVLLAYSGGQTVYYYNFRVVLPRPARQKDGEEVSIGFTGQTRAVEVWMRYRTRDKIYDLAFVRQDLLPGTNRRWVRLR